MVSRKEHWSTEEDDGTDEDHVLQSPEVWKMSRDGWQSMATATRDGSRERLMAFSSDTPPHIQRLMVERLRAMPAWRKLELVVEMSEAVRLLSVAGLRQRHPGDTPDERRRRLADLLLGRELAAEVYGPLSEDN